LELRVKSTTWFPIAAGTSGRPPTKKARSRTGSGTPSNKRERLGGLLSEYYVELQAA